MKINKSLQFLLLLLTGVVLIYFSISKINLSELIDTIKRGSFVIALPIFCISVFGYYVRSLRWRLILQSMHLSPPVGMLFSSLSIGYAVNIATPRLGEVARCLVLKKTSNISLEQSGISVIVERAIDIVTLSIIVLLATLLKARQAATFVQQQILIPIYVKIKQMPWSYVLIIVCVVIIAVLVFRKPFLRWWRTNSFIQLAVQSIKDIVHLQHKLRFGLYTLIIWSCYFLMTYLWFYIFDETQHLGLSEAFVIMAVGSIGRSVPIQGGGMGAYHYLVSNAFAIFGISLLMGNAMAFVIHGAQLLLTFVLGIACWIWVLIYIRNKE
jgi:uncharacterized membrane protein YbhN (UPF0104 family)